MLGDLGLQESGHVAPRDPSNSRSTRRDVAGFNGCNLRNIFTFPKAASPIWLDRHDCPSIPWTGWFAILALVVVALAGRPLHGLDYEPIKDPFRDRFILHLNGLSYHFGGSDEELNEQNWGIGFGYDFGRLSSGSRILDQAVFSFSSEFYSDSFAEFGFALGVSVQNKLVGPIDLGLNAGLLHENNIQEKGGSYLTPFLLPFLETTFDFPVNARLTLIPPWGGLTEGVLTLQALVRF